MKIVANDVAKVTRLFASDEIRPIGGAYLPDIIRSVAQRYEFAVIPSVQDTQQKGAQFQQGRLVRTNGETINIPTLASFSDGVAVTTFDTDSAQAVVDDYIEWMWATFNLRQPTTKPQTFYESNLVVEFGSPIANVMRGFDRLRRLYERMIASTYDQQISVHFSTIGIGMDPSGRGPFLKSDFGIARRLNRPYSEERYFSLAPLQTKDHIELLTTLEEILSDLN